MYGRLIERSSCPFLLDERNRRNRLAEYHVNAVMSNTMLCSQLFFSDHYCKHVLSIYRYCIHYFERHCCVLQYSMHMRVSLLGFLPLSSKEAS